jgi:hypothetical protein
MRRILLALALSTGLLLTATSAWAGKTTKMDTPVLNCGSASEASLNVLVCAGIVTGAPAGFSLQWVSAEQLAVGPDGIPGTLDDNTWPASESLAMCKASFSGNANGSSYNLSPKQCTTVNVGDNLFDNPGASSNCASIPLQCGTTYAFRSFAHANSKLFRSDFTGNLLCTTQACLPPDDGCTFTQGYWKTHGPIPAGNNVNEWPVAGLTLGSVAYTDLELQSIFDKGAAGNGLISLAHQLMAAKLNVANGADDSSIAGTIISADVLIGSLVVPPVGTGSLPSSMTSALNGTLTAFNEGTIGPGHCE